MRMVARLYQAEDHTACKALWAELTRRHRDIYGDPSIGGVDPGQGLETYLSNPNRQATWVAAAKGQVVGMAGLIVRGEEAEVEPVIVTAAYRGRGIGGMLVRHAVRHAKKKGIRFLSARPVARNAEAIAFFVEAGFDIMGQIDLFQDLTPAAGRCWKTGMLVHGKQLRY
jgi:N-acetylglutamate synthase-like GNAT family acetyltransferase